jgi:hypothetical protein
MSLELTGKLIKLLPEVSGDGKNGRWVKQEFILELGGEFTKSVCFSLWGEEKAKIIKSFKIGETIKVSFDVSSREYNDKYFTDCRAWKIEKTGAAAKETVKSTELPPLDSYSIPPENQAEDDLPF